jgi:cytochrome b561
MDKDSYRFIVRCLGWSIVLIVIASIAFGFLKIDAGQLAPVLAPIGALLGGLLVVPPTK